MTAVDLGQTRSARALVPGDVSDLVDCVWGLRDLTGSLHDAGACLARIDTADGWRGLAAEAFRARFEREPQRWTRAGDAFERAADALDRHASALAWAQAEAEGAIARYESAREMTHPVEVSVAERERAGAHEMLVRARAAVAVEARSAAVALRVACEDAPATPSFWAEAGVSVGSGASVLGRRLGDAGVAVVNGLASLGNAALHNPVDVAAIAAGGLLINAGRAGEMGGLALDATGVGAAAGVPINVASAGIIVAGAGLVSVAGVHLAESAVGTDRIEVIPRDSGSRDPGARPQTKTDRLKEHLTDRDLDAARRELNGEVVARKPDGTPWDHVDEVQAAQRGLVNRIDRLQRELADARISDAARTEAQRELGEASRLLDHTRGFVP